MRRKPGFAYNLVFFLLTLVSGAPAQSDSIHLQIEQTYNFQPHVLSDQQITEKSAVLDQFWNKAKAEPSVYVTALRQELGDFKNPPFFLYDGSVLLLSLSNTQADRKIALAAMADEDARAAAVDPLAQFQGDRSPARAHSGAKLRADLPAASNQPGLLVAARRGPLEERE